MAEKELSFWGHLDELRRRLIRICMAVVAGTIVAFINRELIFDKIILAPKNGDFISYHWLCRLGKFLNVPGLCMEDMNLKIINFDLSGQLMTHVKISILAGVILSTPFIFWQAWQFIRPALYPKEQKYAKNAVFIMSGLFFIGVFFSYFFMVPWTLNFLGTYQVSSEVANQIQISSYISTVVSVVLSVGTVFELPVIVFVLVKLGILTPEFLKKNRKYSFVVILIAAAIITPPDVISQIIVTIPLYGLYEVSIVVAKRVTRKQRERELALRTE